MSVADGPRRRRRPRRAARPVAARVRHCRPARARAVVDETGFRAELDRAARRASATGSGAAWPSSSRPPTSRRPPHRSPTPLSGAVAWSTAAPLPARAPHRVRLRRRGRPRATAWPTCCRGSTDHQRPLAAALEVDPAPAELREHADFFGNRATYFAGRPPHTPARRHREQRGRGRRAAEPSTWPALDRPVGGRPRPAGPGRADAGALEARPFVLPLAARAGLAGGRRLSRPRSFRPGGRSAPRWPTCCAGSTTDFGYSARGDDGLDDAARGARRAARASARTSPTSRSVPALGRPAPRATSAATSRRRRRPAGPGWSAPTPRTPGSRRTCRDLGWVELDPTNDQLVDERYVVAALRARLRATSPRSRA